MSYLKVHALRADNDGCGYYRITLPTDAASEHGVDITVDDELDVEAWEHSDGTVRVSHVNIDADVIIFQRPLRGAFTAAIRQAQKQGIACVVEIDDDFSSISSENTAYAAVNPKLNKTSNWQHLQEACDIADWVTVSTPALARQYGRHGRVSIIRNALHRSVLDIPKTAPDGPLRVGWTGTVNTHPHDLEAAGAHVGTALRNNELSFSIIGDGYQVREKLGINSVVHFEELGWTFLEDYHPALAAWVDIGIVPLELSRFNQAKSYLKGLEMSAVGIPFIASPTEEYLFLHSLGAGRIAKKGIEWQKHILTLSQSRDFWLQESERHREVASHLIIDNFVELWISAWVDATIVRRGKSSD